MYVALRDIRSATGRFTLIGSVILLITVLVVLLSGLTAGLANESTSGVTGLPADRLAFGGEESFANSAVTERQTEIWAAAEGVRWATPLGVTQGRLEFAGGAAPVTVFGVRPGGPLAPAGLTDGTVVLSRPLAEEKGLRAGDPVTVGATQLTVAAIGGDDYFSHTPVVWAPTAVWQSLRGARPAPPVGTVIAVKLGDGADPARIDAAAGTSSRSLDDSLDAIGSYSSENGSLLLMQAFLYAISALVVGAFLTVWTIQRGTDVAILKALGGSTGYLLRDALAQALIVLLAGTGVGGALGAGLGALAATAVPFQLTVATTVLPVGVMIALGMLGAALAIRRIISVDPLIALGVGR